MSQLKNIDEAWLKISHLIGGPLSGKVWDTKTNNPKNINDVYTTPIPPTSPTGSTPFSPNICFPLSIDSFKSDLKNWGQGRQGGNRCHAGRDFLTKQPGKVIAIADGIVTNIMSGWTTCYDQWGVDKSNPAGKEVSAVLVYHPSLDQTVNYGEIDFDKISVTKRQEIKKGQLIGVASYCGMLHFELYEGRWVSTSQWEPPSGESSVGSKNKCANEFLSSKPNGLLNPNSLINSISNNFCNEQGFSVTQPEDQLYNPTSSGAASMFSANIPMGAKSCSNEQNNLIKSPTGSSRVNKYADKWKTALDAKNVYGTSWVGKLNSNGGTDDRGLSEPGRLTIIFAPCTTDFSKPVEIMYYYHGIYAFGFSAFL